ncbi:hypothetical protein BDV98DRAFT_52586 [Pterulicium gracile]|uniref:Uncharacterized protein n=1 Tax=Pterulicium gracile TaxID=1884261 RepID=A0A5C3QLC3_9AGAR|nr:hypothetical protein BDV98DRAFT_52586 [Pterula gracilis]
MNVAALLQDSPSEQRTPRQQLAAQQQQQQQPGHRSSSSSPSVAFPNGSGPVMGSLRPGQDGFGKVDTGPEIEMAERDRAREHDPVRERERLLRKVEDVAGSSSVVDDNRTPFGLRDEDAEEGDAYSTLRTSHTHTPRPAPFPPFPTRLIKPPTIFPPFPRW